MMKVLMPFAMTVLSLLQSSVAWSDNKGSTLTLITNVHVFDGVSETRQMNASVLIENNLIKQVSSQAIDVEDATVTVIDGGGRTLMPGLIDMHWHSAYASVPMAVGLNSDHAYHLLIAAKRKRRPFFAALPQSATSVATCSHSPN